MLKALKKKLQATNEDLARMLETLDRISVPTDQIMSRLKRKFIATEIIGALDRGNHLLQEVSDLLKDSPSLPVDIYEE